MPKRSLNRGNGDENQKKIEQLNKAVDIMLARADGKPGRAGREIEPLMRIAAELRNLPRENFKARLKFELGGQKRMSAVVEPVATVRVTASPRLAFRDPAKAIEFYTRALRAKETFRFQVGDSIPHAELMIGESPIDVTGEWPEGGRFSAETLGNSPISISIQVPDVDAFTKHAVAEGMKLVREPKDQFYGHRDATVQDPFGYTWAIFTVKEEMSVQEMHRRMKGATGPESPEPSQDKNTTAPVQVRPGFPTITPYLVAQNAESLIDFIKKTFVAEELSRDTGSAGGYHCELRVEDSTLMIGGGAPNLKWKGDSVLGSFHIYVRDCDATYKLALQSDAKSLHAPADQPWGERTAHVVDPEGNRWYIATFQGENHRSEGAPAIQPFLHPLRAEPVIKFLKAAFAAEELGRFTSPDGVIHHTTLNIGTSHLEMGEAEGPYQPMKSMFYLYVPDSDALYRSAVAAGATSIHEPKDQPYGDRVAAVTDPFGNQWWLGTPIRK